MYRHILYIISPYGELFVFSSTGQGAATVETTRTGSERRSDLSRFWEEIESGGWGAGHPYMLLMGLDPVDTSRLVERIEAGLSYAELERLRRNVGLSREQMAELARIKPRTLDRRKTEGRLHPDESDRLLRVSRIFGRAIVLFENDLEDAREWLASSKRALGGAVPLEMAKTEIGAREVEDLIGRLEHGIFS
jgi:putative toxin-antitoxin system antitoxin component (TIGR02293 family)